MVSGGPLEGWSVANRRLDERNPRLNAGLDQKDTRYLKVPAFLVVAFSGWLSKGVIVIAQLFSVRLLTSSLGIESYSAISLILGLNAWFSLLDFGLGTTLQNTMSESRARNEASYDHVLTAAALAFVLMACGVALVYLVSPLAAGLYLRNVHTLTIEQKAFFFALGGGALCVSSISTLAMKAWYAQRKGYLANAWVAAGSVLSLIAVAVVARLDAHDRSVVAVVACTFPNAFVGLLCLGWHAVASCVKGGRLRGKVMRGLLSKSANVWAFGVLSACVLQLDYVILSQVASARDVVIYNIVTKLMLVAGIIHTSVLQAVWPEFSELFISKDRQRFFIRIRGAIGIGALVITAWILCCVAFRGNMLEIIAPRLEAEVPAALILLVGAYYIVRAWTDTFSTALSSTGNLKALWRWVPIQAVVSVALLYFLGPRWGVWGVVIATLLSFLLTVGWALPVEVGRMFVTPSLSVRGE